MSTLLPFTSVPVRARRDGWTPLTQARFIFELARTRNVAAACRAVGRSWQTAYRLRARPDAASFAAAWDAALAPPILPADLTGRAMGGIARPISIAGGRSASAGATTTGWRCTCSACACPRASAPRSRRAGRAGTISPHP